MSRGWRRIHGHLRTSERRKDRRSTITCAAFPHVGSCYTTFTDATVQVHMETRGEPLPAPPEGTKHEVRK